ncbi:MAG: hypothetical protein ACLRQ0_11410 [Monoglobales bacterium]
MNDETLNLIEINEIRDKLKNETLKDSVRIIDNSALCISEKYQLMRELYQIKKSELDVFFLRSGMTFDEWVRLDADDYVGCIWPSNEMSNELEKHIYDDFLKNYRNSSVQIFNPPFEKVMSGTFKYDVCYLILEQILDHPADIKGFDKLNKDDIWFAVEWLLYLGKLDFEQTLVGYKKN